MNFSKKPNKTILAILHIICLRSGFEYKIDKFKKKNNQTP